MWKKIRKNCLRFTCTKRADAHHDEKYHKTRNYLNSC